MKQATVHMQTNAPDEIASPCIDVCRMSEVTGYCEGCRRSIAEIAGWSGYTNEQKRAVLARLPERGRRP
jgi:predicted Fe-S protein YdhL (DUF1289 family)